MVQDAIIQRIDWWSVRPRAWVPGKIIEKDMVHQKADRDRLSEIMDDPKAAESLILWHHGKPIEHELDVIVFRTGYRLAIAVNQGKMIVTLGENQSLHEKWRKEGISTIHRDLSSEVSNLFSSRPWQAPTSANYPYMLDQLTIHVASILSEMDKEARSRNPYEDAWAAEVLSRARGLARVKLCTPSYMNAEGSVDHMKPEKALQAAGASIWGTGMTNFVGTLEKWGEGL
ncbi:uncharacterized protein N7503_000512 [Penicillium pulvis]|uniref:uncharacterized protein n=1 Tax=Penicillium pulvis TaxID=1562058 RepID=UPI0025498433|nr:uncharacterized protein N7503_000512 [Penicillium pulvis]KAJ5813762.1 hypothetical protein N7503_000512 [Penicillium pulvis]